MFINFWYVAEESKNVTDGPVHVRMLGQDFVVFRDSSGAAKCLSNVCIHRGASLALGKVKGDCVQCPYHGWQFDGEGVCRRIPSMGPDAKIPPRAKVDSYPTQEKYGLIFAFLGDLPEEQRPPILDIPEWDKEDWRPTFQRFEWDFDYKRSIENAVDLAHNEFTHTTQVERRKDRNFVIPEIDLVETDWEIGFYLTMPGSPTHDKKMQKASGKTKAGASEVYTGFHGISSFRTLIHPTPTFHTHQYFFESPVDESHTRLFFFNLRNFMLDESGDKSVLKQNEFVTFEDRDVLEPLRPVLTPRTNNKETFVPADKPIARYREKVKEYEAKGWRIDIDEVNRNKHKTAYAIPSPARRVSKGWALDPIPLLSSGELSLSKAAP